MGTQNSIDFSFYPFLSSQRCEQVSMAIFFLNFFFYYLTFQPYRIVLVSANHQHESVIGTHMRPCSPLLEPPFTFLPHPSPLGCYRAPFEIPEHTANSIGYWSCCCCSVTQLCPTVCDPVDYSTPDFPVLHYLPELAQSHVH